MDGASGARARARCQREREKRGIEMSAWLFFVPELKFSAFFCRSLFTKMRQILKESQNVGLLAALAFLFFTVWSFLGPLLGIFLKSCVPGNPGEGRHKVAKREGGGRETRGVGGERGEKGEREEAGTAIMLCCTERLLMGRGEGGGGYWKVSIVPTTYSRLSLFEAPNSCLRDQNEACMTFGNFYGYKKTDCGVHVMYGVHVCGVHCTSYMRMALFFFPLPSWEEGDE